ncbi:NADPH-dependent FMN reductase [Algicella marina]|uniref:NADPH-dependent FMN reductase n=1 Tax=Algicella marina TaxID=2683284 RepID=A0A6P1T651_9RHOB|nr:NAD(P)H-dependent oxidoreductase [Algicella marina]QHQ36042.1 NADPH-dependent FMN reductase [Algicella marina]
MSYSILGLSGALRRDSSNTKLMHEAARAFAPDRFTFGSIRFPLYDGDLEEAEGIPAGVALLTEQIAEADGVIIATPEYNKNLPGVLKNALDWLSRTGKSPLKGKPVAIMSCAAGRAGGDRSQFSLRHCLTPFQPIVLQGPEVMIVGANKAFGADGRLIDPKSFQILTTLMDGLRAEIRAHR